MRHSQVYWTGRAELVHQGPLDPMQDIHFCLYVIIVKEILAEEEVDGNSEDAFLKGDSV